MKMNSFHCVGVHRIISVACDACMSSVLLIVQSISYLSNTAKVGGCSPPPMWKM